MKKGKPGESRGRKTVHPERNGRLPRYMNRNDKLQLNVVIAKSDKIDLSDFFLRLSRKCQVPTILFPLLISQSARHALRIFLLNLMGQMPISEARNSVPAHFLTVKGVNEALRFHQRGQNA